MDANGIYHLVAGRITQEANVNGIPVIPDMPGIPDIPGLPGS